MAAHVQKLPYDMQNVIVDPQGRFVTPNDRIVPSKDQKRPDQREPARNDDHRFWQLSWTQLLIQHSHNSRFAPNNVAELFK